MTPTLNPVSCGNRESYVPMFISSGILPENQDLHNATEELHPC